MVGKCTRRRRSTLGDVQCVRSGAKGSASSSEIACVTQVEWSGCAKISAERHDHISVPEIMLWNNRVTERVDGRLCRASIQKRVVKVCPGIRVRIADIVEHGADERRCSRREQECQSRTAHSSVRTKSRRRKFLR